jgi:hypothetical protein
VAPVGAPEQDVVSSTEQDNERRKSKREHTSSCGNITHNFLPAVCEPHIGLVGAVSGCGQDDVENEKHENIPCLSECGRVAETKRKSANMVGAEDGRIY